MSKSIAAPRNTSEPETASETHFIELHYVPKGAVGGDVAIAALCGEVFIPVRVAGGSGGSTTVICPRCDTVHSNGSAR